MATMKAVQMAQAVAAVRVLMVEQFGREQNLVVPCADFDVFKTLRAAGKFEGRQHGLTVWNSDRGHAYYKSDARVATPTIELGTLGARSHYRCRNCGVDFSEVRR